VNVIHYADLDLAAVVQHRDRELAAWYSFRTTDDTGTGRVSRDQVENVRHQLGWSPRFSARVLRDGADTFWRVTPRGVVYLRGPATIAGALGVTSFHVAYWAPLDDLRGALGAARARLVMRAVAALRKGRPVSNATIAEMVHTSIRTITQWRRTARVHPRENFVLVAPLHPGQIAGDLRASAPALRTVRFRGRRWVARRIADSLQIPEVGGRSRLRHVNRRLRLLAGAASSASSDGGPARRLYAPGSTRRAPATPSPGLPVYDVITPLGEGRRSHRAVRVWGSRSEVSGRSFVHGDKL